MARESAELQKEEEEERFTTARRASISINTASDNWSLHRNFKGGETTEASSISNKQAMVGVSTAEGGDTTEVPVNLIMI